MKALYRQQALSMSASHSAQDAVSIADKAARCDEIIYRAHLIFGAKLKYHGAEKATQWSLLIAPSHMTGLAIAYARE